MVVYRQNPCASQILSSILRRWRRLALWILMAKRPLPSSFSTSPQRANDPDIVEILSDGMCSANSTRNFVGKTSLLI